MIPRMASLRRRRGRLIERSTRAVRARPNRVAATMMRAAKRRAGVVRQHAGAGLVGLLAEPRRERAELLVDRLAVSSRLGKEAADGP